MWETWCMNSVGVFGCLWSRMKVLNKKQQCAVKFNSWPLVGAFSDVTQMFFRAVFLIAAPFSTPSGSTNRSSLTEFQYLSVLQGRRFLMWTSCSFPTSLDPKEHIFFCLGIPLVTVLAAIVSCGFPVEGKHLAQTVRVLILAHIRRFYTSQARSVNNQNCRSQAKESAIMLNTASFPKLRSLCLTRLNKPLRTVLFAFEVSSVVPPLVSKQKPHCMTHAAPKCKTDNVTHIRNAPRKQQHVYWMMCNGLMLLVLRFKIILYHQRCSRKEKLRPHTSACPLLCIHLQCLSKSPTEWNPQSH